MLPVSAQLRVAGSYNSAVATGSEASTALTPPATSTRPSRSSVAVGNDRAVSIAPVAVHFGGTSNVGLAVVIEGAVEAVGVAVHAAASSPATSGDPIRRSGKPMRRPLGVCRP